MKLAQELIRFGQQLADESEAASNLWTWLPSHKIAVKHHDDYALEHCPSVKDVLVEAAMYLAIIRDPPREYTPEEQEWFTSCPCGEDHEP